MNARECPYFLPERGESQHDARVIPIEWAEDCDTLDEVSEIIARYHNSIDPQSTDITVAVMYENCVTVFEVQAENVLMFRAVEVSY